MKANLLTVLAATAGVMLAAVPVLADHSFAAEFDQSQPITMTGVVTKSTSASRTIKT